MYLKTLRYSLLIFLGFLKFSYSQQQSAEDGEWFAFQPKNTLENGIIGMTDWLDAPAGKHGFHSNGPVKICALKMVKKLNFGV
jgi:hypothetical protein